MPPVCVTNKPAELRDGDIMVHFTENEKCFCISNRRC